MYIYNTPIKYKYKILITLKNISIKIINLLMAVVQHHGDKSIMNSVILKFFPKTKKRLLLQPV